MFTVKPWTGKIYCHFNIVNFAKNVLNMLFILLPWDSNLINLPSESIFA